MDTSGFTEPRDRRPPTDTASEQVDFPDIERGPITDGEAAAALRV